MKRSLRAMRYFTRTEQIKKPTKASDQVIMYHNVLPDNTLNINVRQITSNDFYRELSYLKRRHQVVPLNEMYTPNTTGKHRVAITLDDGLVNNLRYALPVLEKLQLPASIFVTTIHLRNQNVLWPDAVDTVLSGMKEPIVIGEHRFVKPPNRMYIHEKTEQRLIHFLKTWTLDQKWELLHHLAHNLHQKPWSNLATEDIWRVMNEDELRKISQSPLIELGTHGITHSNFPTLDEVSLREELTESKRFLEAVIGKPVQSVAFPDGSYTRRTLDIAEECGYTRQVAVNFLHEEDYSDRRLIGRMGLYDDESVTDHLHLINSLLNRS